MKGEENHTHQQTFGFCAEDRVPLDHPIRGIKKFVEGVLRGIRDELSDMYSLEGRPSIPPETLLKSMVLMALFSVRSERQFCDMLKYNLLFQWFLNMSVMDPVFNASVFSKNRSRLLEHDIARKFFDEVNRHLEVAGVFASEHFSVDGTLIESWASLKSLKERDSKDFRARTKGKHPSEIGRNDRYVSTTDPEACLARKPGVFPKLSYMGNVLMENSSGLCVDLEVLPATGTSEVEAAIRMVRRQKANGVKIATLGADANYHRQEFVSDCRNEHVIPHVAPQADRKLAGLDGRTLSSPSYVLSQSSRKNIEKIFSWLKTVGTLKRTRFRGSAKLSMYALLAVSAFNIMRSLKLAAL